MFDLHSTLSSVLNDRYAANAARVRELAAPLSNSQFWQKPFPFGNSFGHLVLHLTGNLNYYIGAQIAGTGYVRHRDLEFTDAQRKLKEEVLADFDHAITVVIDAIRKQSPEDWTKPYAAEREPESSDRFTAVFRCAAHAYHHVGQLIYLSNELTRSEQAARRGA